jgi:chromosome segregation protein
MDDWPGAAPQPGDPAPPPNAVLLIDHVDAPDQLARRLAQVFVVEADAGEPLAAGQRIVTRDGALRRWDGFVATGSGAAAAERLERINRARALARERPAALLTVEQADAARAATDTAIAAARAAADGGRAAVKRADEAGRIAQRDEDRAAATLDRLAGQRADLEQRAARIAPDVAEADAERARATAAVAALPDGRASSDAVTTLSHVADQRRAAVAQARADRSGLDRSLAADRARLAAVQADARSWRARAGEAAKRITEMDKRAAARDAEAAAIGGRPAVLAAEIATIEEAHNAARADADGLAVAEQASEATLRLAEDAHRVAGDALGAAREARAGAAARVENQELRRVEMGRLAGERFECPAPVLPEKLGFDSATVCDPATESTAHERLSADRERIGPVNLVAERELAELEAASLGNNSERDELGQAVARLRGSIGTLNREGRQRMRAAFEAVDGHFRRLFAALFDGGQAHLEMIDSDDPLEAGLEILAQPPGKRLQSLTLLSGGEQALTAVALIFALFLTNPAPICVLDEVDAPLDDANIERFCDLLDRMVEETDTRYLIVTHNAVTMSRMHRLFGVTMIERGISRLVSVDLQAATTLVAAA